MEKLLEFATSVPDFRRTRKGNIRHKLEDVLILIILARISKCIGRTDIIGFSMHNLTRFRSMGMLKNGVPSEPTLFRIENGIDEAAMADRMKSFMGGFHDELNPDIGSARSHATGLTLATKACHEKSNEIKAVPHLLDKIDISGKVITADAMSMQKEIIEKIRQKDGDFLIELKANQRSMRYGVEDKLCQVSPIRTERYGPELDHGRIETRTYCIYDGLELIADKEKWGGLQTQSGHGGEGPLVDREFPLVP